MHVQEIATTRSNELSIVHRTRVVIENSYSRSRRYGEES
jgi:hypothetical protein